MVNYSVRLDDRITRFLDVEIVDEVLGSFPQLLFHFFTDLSIYTFVQSEDLTWLEQCDVLLRVREEKIVALNLAGLDIGSKETDVDLITLVNSVVQAM